jgi:hypothetical protein
MPILILVFSSIPKLFLPVMKDVVHTKYESSTIAYMFLKQTNQSLISILLAYSTKKHFSLEIYFKKCESGGVSKW